MTTNPVSSATDGPFLGRRTSLTLLPDTLTARQEHPGLRPRLSVVVPTRNERHNVGPLTERLAAALDGLDAGWELVFVDDSDDETPAAIRAGMTAGLPVRLVHRPAGYRPGGLAGAVVSGISNTVGDVVVVMDADLQHPPELVPELAAPLLDANADVSVATRYAGGGMMAGLDGPWRRVVSRGSRTLAHAAFPQARPASDPCSGFFGFRRDVVNGIPLHPNGFKILLEVLVRGRWERVHEAPYLFGERRHGSSNAGTRQGVQFLVQVALLHGGRRQRALVGPPARRAPAGDFWRLAATLRLRRIAGRR
jgi:glycosyltransferase involved in cell wall biosynthesis